MILPIRTSVWNLKTQSSKLSEPLEHECASMSLMHMLHVLPGFGTWSTSPSCCTHLSSWLTLHVSIMLNCDSLGLLLGQATGLKAPGASGPCASPAATERSRWPRTPHQTTAAARPNGAGARRTGAARRPGRAARGARAVGEQRGLDVGGAGAGGGGARGAVHTVRACRGMRARACVRAWHGVGRA